MKLELCRLCTGMPNPICVTDNAIHESHCSVQCFVLGYVIKDESDYGVLLFLLQSLCKDDTVQASQIMAGEKMMTAHALLVFLGLLIF